MPGSQEPKGGEVERDAFASWLRRQGFVNVSWEDGRAPTAQVFDSGERVPVRNEWCAWQAALAAPRDADDRERCARVCDERAAWWRKQRDFATDNETRGNQRANYEYRYSDLCEARASELSERAAAIRALPSPSSSCEPRAVEKARELVGRLVASHLEQQRTGTVDTAAAAMNKEWGARWALHHLGILPLDDPAIAAEFARLNDEPRAGGVEEVARLRGVIERDRSLLARCLQEHRKSVGGYSWIREGRGPYEWDDDEYREEFGRAKSAVEKALEPLDKVARDLTDCPTTDAEVKAARASLPRAPSRDGGGAKGGAK